MDKIPHDQIARMEMLNGKGKPLTITVSNEHIDKFGPPPNTVEYVQKIVQWHHDRNLIEGSTDKDQFCKLMQEAGELSDSICKGKDVSDDIGDMIVVLLNIAERNGLTLRDCLAKAWDDIKDRKGRMVDGIFVKEGD